MAQRKKSLIKDGKLDKHGKPNANTPKDFLEGYKSVQGASTPNGMTGGGDLTSTGSMQTPKKEKAPDTSMTETPKKEEASDMDVDKTPSEKKSEKKEKKSSKKKKKKKDKKE